MIKVERRKEAPKSLALEKMKANGDYRKQDVVDALREDFYDKCYICGIKEPQSPEIEHRIPHHGNAELKFDWNNLFWACGHCNSVKNKKKYDVGILDCCVDDPEEKIDFRVEGNHIFATAKDDSDSQAVLTAELICETFNDENTAMRTVTCKRIRDGLMKEMNLLYQAIENVQNMPQSKVRNRMLVALLTKESAFAEFKRTYYKECFGELPE